MMNVLYVSISVYKLCYITNDEQHVAITEM